MNATSPQAVLLFRETLCGKKAFYRGSILTIAHLLK
uniref:Uncharacterized protein n=1 Tax=uncultured marine bacterium 582 TaxID=257402 RepID=Q6SEV9_9BACT|nr:hypothetical protein MBMO_EBAC080-L028H02.132 [uncultured marine bacterium 582]